MQTVCDVCLWRVLYRLGMSSSPPAACARLCPAVKWLSWQQNVSEQVNWSLAALLLLFLLLHPTKTLCSVNDCFANTSRSTGQDERCDGRTHTLMDEEPSTALRSGFLWSRSASSLFLHGDSLSLCSFSCLWCETSQQQNATFDL